ncbi:MAG: energy-coupling factor transporter transmembrane component T, partial [Rhodoluna sp.]
TMNEPKFIPAMQRLQVTLQSWAELRFIHRIRGVGLGRGPKARISEWSRLVFGLLVQSIRSAGATAVAMDSRGFSHALMRERTWAAKPRWACLDWRVTLLALVAAILPLLVA